MQDEVRADDYAYLLGHADLHYKLLAQFPVERLIHAVENESEHSSPLRAQAEAPDTETEDAIAKGSMLPTNDSEAILSAILSADAAEEPEPPIEDLTTTVEVHGTQYVVFGSP